MASLTQWTWVWARSGRWWRTGKPDVLQSLGVSKSWTQVSDWTTIVGDEVEGTAWGGEEGEGHVGHLRANYIFTPGENPWWVYSPEVTWSDLCLNGTLVTAEENRLERGKGRSREARLETVATSQLREVNLPQICRQKLWQPVSEDGPSEHTFCESGSCSVPLGWNDTCLWPIGGRRILCYAIWAQLSYLQLAELWTTMLKSSYSKSPTYERVLFRERFFKSNLFEVWLS